MMRALPADLGVCEPEPDRLDDGGIRVALVNNMPDAALRTTERQFRELLTAASQGRDVRLVLFALPDIPRSAAASAHIAAHYRDISELWGGRVDGLIVTGTEPRVPVLDDEPYWPALTRLVDWAEDHTSSTIWSCLAAHAAVLHTDEIHRQTLPQKLSGVFACAKAAEHPIMAGAAPCWHVPHSRYNGLPEEALASAGYLLLSHSSEAGADMFLKQGKSLFLFLQGHPEYDPGALLREYQRDVSRFFAGTRDKYPAMPRGYFDAAMAAKLAVFQERALQTRDPVLLSSFPATAAALKPVHAWHEAAVRLYSRWLSHLAEQSSGRLSAVRSRGL